jgi:hypothetical protein
MFDRSRLQTHVVAEVEYSGGSSRRMVAAPVGSSAKTRVAYLVVMADGSGIEWTEATWNPTTGCDRISPVGDNCYVLVLAKRLKAMGNPKYQSDGDPRIGGGRFAVRSSLRRDRPSCRSGLRT